MGNTLNCLPGLVTSQLGGADGARACLGLPLPPALDPLGMIGTEQFKRNKHTLISCT